MDPNAGQIGSELRLERCPVTFRERLTGRTDDVVHD
jgi:hypothetical protein